MDIKTLETLTKYLGVAKSLNMRSVIEEYHSKDYDLNPPYQREIVWETAWKIDLINSLCTGIPLSTIHLVKVNDDEHDNRHYVLDGKQRLSAIFSFIDNEYKINIPLIPEGNKSGNKSFNYSQIEVYSKNPKSLYHKKKKRSILVFKEKIV